MHRQALALRRKLLGEEHVDTARSVYELADLLSRMGDYAEAEPLFREALELRRKLRGKKSPEVAESIEGLALNLYEDGNYIDSIKLMREASRCGANCTMAASCAGRCLEQSRLDAWWDGPVPGRRAAIPRGARDEEGPAG
jgi:tetratricopeptide (TPR) repeat protein